MTDTATPVHYRGHHSLSPATTQLDGYLESANGQRLQLDVISLNDDELTPDDINAARAAEAAGRAHLIDAATHGAPTLVVLEPVLTVENITRAIQRLLHDHDIPANIALDI